MNVFTERSGAWAIHAYTATKVVFLVEDYNSCVPNSFNVLSEELAGKLLGHSLREIVYVKHHFWHFLVNEFKSSY